MNHPFTTTLGLVLLVQSTSAQPLCTPSCKGTTSDGTNYDLSGLMGQDFQTVGDQGASTYFLNVCGTSATQCPDDAGDPPVTNGTAVQTVAAGGCYVLGVRCPLFVLFFLQCTMFHPPFYSNPPELNVISICLSS